MALDSYDILYCNFNSDIQDDYGGKVLTGSGGATISTSIKKYGAGSLQLVSATSSYVYSPANADFNVGASSFSIQNFYRFASLPTSGNAVTLFSSWGSSPQKGYKTTVHNNGGQYELRFYWTTDGATEKYFARDFDFVIDTFYHIYVGRENGFIGLFVDGLSIGSYHIDTATIAPSSNNFIIGAEGATPTNFVDGFVDGFRFSLGVNRETLISFDPPVTQYTPDVYDSLLLHMDGADGGTTFVDSTGNFTPTANGTIVTKTSDGAINPVIGSAMSKATATPGYLTFPDSDLFNYSTVDFTVEGYVNLDDIRVHSVLYDQRDSGFSGFGLVFELNADETMMVQFDTVALVRVQLLTAPLNISTDVWYHWCAMRDGENLYFFLDGHMIESKNIGSVQLYNSSGTVYIGFNQFGNGNIDGRMDEVRVSKGISRFSIANFTPPTGEEYSGTNRLKYYNGSAWVAKPVKYYNGSAWVTKQLKYHNGSSWT